MKSAEELKGWVGAYDCVHKLLLPPAKRRNLKKVTEIFNTTIHTVLKVIFDKSQEE